MKIKKVISVIMTAVMLFCCFSVGATAARRYKYVVLGDSIAYGSGLVNARDACYGKIIADNCGFDYENHAVPGATTYELIYEFNNKEVRSAVARADIISISIGGNDFLNELTNLMYSAIVKKDYKQFDTIEFGIYSNISYIIDSIREVNSSAVILLQTLYNPQFDYLKDLYQMGADRVNAAVRRCAKENKGVAVVDVASALNGDESNFADDTMHPTAKGNELIAREVLRTLKKLGYTNKTKLDIKAKGIDVVLGSGVYNALNFYAFFLSVLARLTGAISLIVK